jgi:hypothetical protein
MSFIKRLFGKPEQQPEPQQQERQQPEYKQQEQQQQPADNPPQAETTDKPKGTVILPRIKVNYSHSMYADDGDKTFKGNEPGFEIPHEQQPIMQNLYEDLLLCFAVDTGSSYELLQNRILPLNPGLTPEKLYEACVHGLAGEVDGQIKIHGDPEEIVMVTAGGNFEAALILLPYFWEHIHNVMGSEVIAAIPARDLLFITKASNPAAIFKLKNMVKESFENEKTQGLLSKGLYLHTAGQAAMQLKYVAF